jgi:hypothetical protein
MKRFWLLGLSIFLAGCSIVSPAIPKVVVSPKDVILGRGEARELTASLESGTANDFNWSVKAGEGSFNNTNGTSAAGSKVTYTAPQNDGEYKITVSAVAVEATSAVTTVTVAEQATATLAFDVNNPLRSGVVSPNGSKRYIVEAPASLTEPLLKFEVGTSQPITLKVFDANNQLLATSNDKTFFTKETGQAANQALEAQFLTLRCDGPCVAIPRTGGRYFVLIEAGNTQVNYRFDAYDDVYSDDTEPANNDCVTSNAQQGPEGDFTQRGAIETLGDIDCFNTGRAVTSIKLRRLPDVKLSLKAEITNLTTNKVDVIELKQGDSVTEQGLTFAPAAPLKIVVTSSDGRAGPSLNSGYDIVFK